MRAPLSEDEFSDATHGQESFTHWDASVREHLYANIAELAVSILLQACWGCPLH